MRTRNLLLAAICLLGLSGCCWPWFDCGGGEFSLDNAETQTTLEASVVAPSSCTQQGIVEAALP